VIKTLKLASGKRPSSDPSPSRLPNRFSYLRLPCKRTSSNARRHGSTRTAASIETRVFISSSEADELSLLLLIKLQLPKTQTETLLVIVE